MRFVFDTSVIISALLLEASTPRLAFDCATGTGKVLLSFAVLEELHQVLARRKFRKYVTDDEAREFLAALLRQAEWIEVNVSINACRDARDNKFLELAVSGDASHIVTGDSDLLILKASPS